MRISALPRHSTIAIDGENQRLMSSTILSAAQASVPAASPSRIRNRPQFPSVSINASSVPALKVVTTGLAVPGPGVDARPGDPVGGLGSFGFG